MRIQYASDVTERLNKRQLYESQKSDPTRFQWHNFNPTGLTLNFLLGRVECKACEGVMPYVEGSGGE